MSWGGAPRDQCHHLQVKGYGTVRFLDPCTRAVPSSAAPYPLIGYGTGYGTGTPRGTYPLRERGAVSWAGGGQGALWALSTAPGCHNNTDNLIEAMWDTSQLHSWTKSSPLTKPDLPQKGVCFNVFSYNAGRSLVHMFKFHTPSRLMPVRSFIAVPAN